MILGTIRYELNNIPAAAESFRTALRRTEPSSTSLVIRRRSESDCEGVLANEPSRRGTAAASIDSRSCARFGGGLGSLSPRLPP